MQLLGSLWTFALLPLSLAAAVCLMIAFDHRSWFTFAALAGALLFSFLRLAGASRARHNYKQYEAAAAAIWNGETISVGIGSARTLVMVGAVGVLIAMAWMFRSMWGGVAVALMVLGSLALAWSLYLAFAAPRRVLRLSREGIWDLKFGLVRWTDLDSVDLREIRVRSTTISCLEACVRPAARAALLASRSRRVLGGFAYLDKAGAKLEYNLGLLDIHPLRARAAAVGWWTLAHHGYIPEPVAPHDDAREAALAFEGNHRFMRTTTRLTLLCYALLPLAFLADIWASRALAR
jgi:hypothetical protein